MLPAMAHPLLDTCAINLMFEIHPLWCQGMEKVLLTTKEISLFLRISTATIDKYRKLGLIPYVKFPSGHVRYEQRKIMKWIEGKSVPGL